MAAQGTVDPGPSAKTTTKATLIDVGTRLILEQGYHQTGIQDVLQAAGVPKGSGVPHKEFVGSVTRAQLREIAEKKMADLNANDLDQAEKIIAGTARSMGITVV